MQIGRYSIRILFVLATVAFFVGVIKYLTAYDDPEAVKKGGAYVLWSIVALAVMTAAWGIVLIIARTFNISTGSNFF